MKVKIFIIFLLFYSLECIAQDNPSFFVKIPDAKYILTTTHDSDDNKIGVFSSPNKALNKLISKYKIYNVEHVFKNSNRESLQKNYLVTCDDIKLMDDLENNFSNIYFYLEDNESETLVLPNDFGTTGGFIEIQEELNHIRAPEAWDITTGSPKVIIGVSDNYVNLNHEDLANKLTVVYGVNNVNGDQHGSIVSSAAAADTNNSLGMSAIGYDSTIYNAVNARSNGVDTLSKMPGVKVINTAWINSARPDIYDVVVEDRGIVVVGSAGNGATAQTGSATTLINPAAFKNVISVTSVAHEDNSFTDHWGNTYSTIKDHHEIMFNGTIRTHQHNDSVDIAAPGYGVLIADPRSNTPLYIRSIGTSLSSPIVSGTIALMFTVNYCIDPKEVETILKLTAVKIDDMSANLPYYGKLGAGKLDAYEAVKMANDMQVEFGTVEVKNRILYRPWFYKLEASPYEIKMTNNNVSGGSKLKFRARNNIEILSGDYFPASGGYIDLMINNTPYEECLLPQNLPRFSNTNNDKEKKAIEKNSFNVYPTLVDNDLTIICQSRNIEKMRKIVISNFMGQEVFSKEVKDVIELNLSLSMLNTGIYVIRIFGEDNAVLHSQKIVKK